MIIQIYSDASYISEPEARSRAGGYFFLGTKFNTLIQDITPYNGPVNVECSILRNVMVSDTEEELGGLLKTAKKRISCGWPYQRWDTNNHRQLWQRIIQQQTVLSTEKKRYVLSNRHRIILGQRQNPTESFPRILGKGNKKLADYVTKHHPILHHREMRPR